MLPAFTPEVFFHFLLPPIILDSAYALYDDDFFENLGLILTFAFVGTFLNVIIVGASLFGLGAAGAMGGFVGDAPSFLNCLTFASLVTLTPGFTFNRQNPRPRLRSRKFAVKTAV